MAKHFWINFRFFDYFLKNHLLANISFLQRTYYYFCTSLVQQSRFSCLLLSFLHTGKFCSLFNVKYEQRSIVSVLCQLLSKCSKNLQAKRQGTPQYIKPNFFSTVLGRMKVVHRVCTSFSTCQFCRGNFLVVFSFDI